jgi:hypothetical protein
MPCLRSVIGRAQALLPQHLADGRHRSVVMPLAVRVLPDSHIGGPWVQPRPAPGYHSVPVAG